MKHNFYGCVLSELNLIAAKMFSEGKISKQEYLEILKENKKQFEEKGKQNEEHNE